jgi:molybdopterin-guanine dinucleotide biosynthesis adapter protein
MNIPRLHIVGLKNAGKTTLCVELAEELGRRGYRIGAVKHSPHAHPLDVPGKDSWRHREAGATPTAFVTGAGAALFFDPPAHGDVYTMIAPFYQDCDLILVEGDLHGEGLKVEVWRNSLGLPPLSRRYPGIYAVISDDRLPVHATRWPRSKLNAIAEGVVDLLSMKQPRARGATIDRYRLSGIPRPGMPASG